MCDCYATVCEGKELELDGRGVKARRGSFSRFSGTPPKNTMKAWVALRSFEDGTDANSHWDFSAAAGSRDCLHCGC